MAKKKSESSETTNGGINIFSILGSMLETKDYIYDDMIDSVYNPFMINRGVSQNLDTILHANEMNKCKYISKHMQYDYYFYSIPAAKRYNKWAKADIKDIDTIKIIADHYHISTKRAEEYIELLSDDDINKIKLQYVKGGCV